MADDTTAAAGQGAAQGAATGSIMGPVGAAVGAVAGAAFGAYGAKKAAEESSKLQKRFFKFAKEQNAQALDKVFKLVDVGEQNLLTGKQATIDFLGQSIGPQMELSRGGNIAAQETLLGGISQIDNILMGRPADYSQLEVYEGGDIPDVSYELPEFESTISEDLKPELSVMADEADAIVTGLYQELYGRDPTTSELVMGRKSVTNKQGAVSPGNLKKYKSNLMKSDDYRINAGAGEGANVLGTSAVAPPPENILGRKGLS